MRRFFFFDLAFPFHKERCHARAGPSVLQADVAFVYILHVFSTLHVTFEPAPVRLLHLDSPRETAARADVSYCNNSTPRPIAGYKN